MLTLDRQERYRRRYSEMRPGWQPSSQVYQDLVTGLIREHRRVLDVGCGRGGVLERLHDHATRVVGLDPDGPSLCEHRISGIPLLCGQAERLPFADGSFDLVCCSWVLEHLVGPQRAFCEVARVLRPGGRFAFVTPNARHPLLLLNQAVRSTKGRLVAWAYARSEKDTFPAAYGANTLKRIERLAHAAGLERVALRFIGDPTYLAFTEPLFGLACLLERVTPRQTRVHLVGHYAAR
jgi:ubiquinone/menaquinone biosynthesis C-methylase UbiE